VDRDLGRPVALKVLNDEVAGDGEAVRRFVEEARVGGQLEHPGIVPVYGLSAGEDDRPFFAMRLLQGDTLDALLSKRERSGHELRRFLGHFEQVCQAMAYAHTRGAVHGDLTPANVIVGRCGEVQIVDWSRAVVGGEPLEDVCALGSILSEILAGAADAEEDLVQLSRRCLSPDPGERPCDAGEIASVVGDHLTEVEERARRAEIRAAEERVRAEAEQARADRERRQARLQRRARIRSLAMAAVVLAAVLGGGSMALLKVREDRAEAERVEAGVADAMRRAARHEGARDWVEAAAWARKAVALAGAMGPEAPALGRARTLLDRIAGAERREQEDVEFTVRLGEIRARALMEFVDPVLRDEDYKAALLECGVDVDGMTASEAAAAVLSRSRPVELTAALDEWALMRWSNRGLPGTDERHLLAIARTADPDEWRDRLRGAVVDLDIEEVRALADTADAGLLPSPTLHLLAKLLAEDGDVETAVEVLRRALLHHPQDVRLIESLGSCLMKLGPSHHLEGVSCYIEALAILPDSPFLWNNLGIALGTVGEAENALPAFHRALELMPDFAMAQTNIGVMWQRQGQFEKAIAAFRRALSMEPDDSNCHMNLGIALNDAGKPRDALAALRKAHELRPDGPWVNFNLGLQFWYVGDSVGAIPYLKKATERCPKPVQAWYMLGFVLQVTKDHAGAVDAYRKALSIEPDNGGALNQLAWLLATSGDPALFDPSEAAELAGRAVRRYGDAFSWGTLAIASCRAGRHEVAIDAAERALGPGGRKRAWGLLVLAHSHAKLGHVEEARDWLAKAVAWMEKNPCGKPLRAFRAEAEAAVRGEHR